MNRIFSRYNFNYNKLSVRISETCDFKLSLIPNQKLSVMYPLSVKNALWAKRGGHVLGHAWITDLHNVPIENLRIANADDGWREHSVITVLDLASASQSLELWQHNWQH